MSGEEVRGLSMGCLAVERRWGATLRVGRRHSSSFAGQRTGVPLGIVPGLQKS